MRKCMYHPAIAPAVLAAAVLGAGQVRAGQLPNPTITANATPFDAARAPANVFDSGGGDYASKSQGVGPLFTTDPNMGTWLNFDFGAEVTIDSFVNRTRANNADVVVESQLVFSQDPTFDAADSIVKFDVTGQNGQGFISRFAPQTARYVRWEAVTAPGVTNSPESGPNPPSKTSPNNKNLGSRQMYFLDSPADMSPLPNPTVVNAFKEFSSGYVPANAANGDAGVFSSGKEYASLNGGDQTFVDFDFGAPTRVGAFDFFDREPTADRTFSYTMTFSNSADFSNPIFSRSFEAVGSPQNRVNSEVFAEAVTAQFVRFEVDVQSGINTSNTGISEMVFYTPVPEPAGLAILGFGALGLLGRRRRRHPRGR